MVCERAAAVKLGLLEVGQGRDCRVAVVEGADFKPALVVGAVRRPAWLDGPVLSHTNFAIYFGAQSTTGRQESLLKQSN